MCRLKVLPPTAKIIMYHFHFSITVPHKPGSCAGTILVAGECYLAKHNDRIRLTICATLRFIAGCGDALIKPRKLVMQG